MGLMVSLILLGIVLALLVAGVLVLMGFIDLISGAPLTIIACVGGMIVAGLALLLMLSAGMPVRKMEVRGADRRWVMEENLEDPEVARPVAPPFQQPAQQVAEATSIDADGLSVEAPVEAPIAPAITESSETSGSLPAWAKEPREQRDAQGVFDAPLVTGLFPSRADCLAELDAAARQRAVHVLTERQGAVPPAAIPQQLIDQLIRARHIESSQSAALEQTMYKAHGLLKFDDQSLRSLDEVWRQQTVGSRLQNTGGAAAGLLAAMLAAWGGLKLTARKREPAPAAV